ncbi:MAG: VCBS repeat-containing protein, partial [Acidobacteriota bacterium]|nr:VCBS repeat-containing protein [Acidobacteriota bacterium]
NITYQPTDIRDVNPRLGALVNNGGTTPTHAVFVHSPLIDKGVNALAVDPFGGNNTALVFDQRGSGFARIVDGNGDGSAIVDVGTFERRIFGDPRPTSGDFDGDGKADIAVFRRSNGFWYVMKSTGGFSAVQWGFGTDTLVPGDYDGDGKTDVAVYRRGSQPTAFGNINDSTWYIRRSSDNTFLTRQYGKGGFYEWDTPMPADYDGDGKTDLGLYGLSDALGSPGNFKVWQSSDGLRYERQWGTNIDQIVPRDYDGDGKADLATVRIEPRFSSNGIAIWQILQSSNGATRQVQFGLATDVTVPRDYDGDGKTDIAVYRPSNGFWYRLNSSDGSFFAIQFGLSTDITVPADYDGDGKTDIAVFRPSNGTWYLQQSKDGFAAYVFGLPDDVPVTSLAR